MQPYFDPTKRNMEDNLNIFENRRRPQFFLNGRQPHLKKNERQRQFFENGRRPQFF